MSYFLRISTAFIFWIGIGFFAPVSAHTLETDGTIQGVLHVQPAHTPTAGEPATIEFFLKDTSKAFNAGTYSYALVVVGEEGSTTLPLSITDMVTVKAQYVFPQQGSYTATLTGSSTVSGVPSFVLDYDDITVLPPGQHENPITSFFGEHGSHVLVVALILLAFFGVVVWDRYIERRFRKKS